jgi:hypothetical protein
VGVGVMGCPACVVEGRVVKVVGDGELGVVS